ncbi:hypothetical protein, partial [Mesorhizobium sp. B1-1-5]|uniref:hypothetical protein n=1 Tax=Mesorhizobium sp. B1-1-5 TaxID=2589979 RepID=UPI001AED6517
RRCQDYRRLRCPSLPCRAFLAVNGEKEAGRDLGGHTATLVIGEIGDARSLLPVHGEKMAAAR